ncbi:MAG: glucosaminidase domain-containing protein [Acidobacteriota bacterium]|nr:glucosaminidase domain-containing protein [Acidobacteriota bacterium]
MMTKEEFVKTALAAAEESSHTSGLPEWVTVAQAALESRWGASWLSCRAHNYFGIKAHKGHAEILLPTTECARGTTEHVTAAFAKYGSMLECFQCRDHLLTHAAVYAAAREKRADEEAFIDEMARHWATDPHYAEKLKAVLHEVKGGTE